jgi:Ca2+-binding RTX toxin-like protein
VKQVAIDLGATGGGGDGATDTVIADGTNGHDAIHVSSTAGGVSITGLAADITITHGESTDAIAINGNGGNDTIDASGLKASDGVLTINGGDGSDTITGGQGSNTIIGGAGDDTINAGHGNSTINYPSVLDGHDVIQGFSSGHDTLNLDALFDNLGVADGDRAGRVSIIDHGNGTVDVAVNADGNAANGFELTVATVHTHDHLTVGHDVVVSG